MRLFMILCWLTLPLLAWAYHVGPGQRQVAIDDAGVTIRQAVQRRAEDDHAGAAALYGKALQQLPSDRASERYAIQLAMAKSQMHSGQLPEARVALQAMLDELASQQVQDVSILFDTRQTLAAAQYYMTWLMRLEGLPAEEWEPEIEAARQHYRWLAESDAESAATHRQDLEAAIRLARMDLDELQALKIPSQCKGCCSGQCKNPSRKPANRRNRQQNAGANLGVLPDGSGS